MKKYLKSKLQSPTAFYMTLEWQITRTMPPGAELSIGSNTVVLGSDEKAKLLDMITSKRKTSKSLNIESKLPKPK